MRFGGGEMDDLFDLVVADGLFLTSQFSSDMLRIPAKPVHDSG